MSQQPSLNEKISFTADGVAYRRAAYTDIPFSKEIFEIMEKICGPFNPEEKAKADGMKNVIPIFESRYLLTDGLLRGSGVDRVLELASGLSPRGFAWTRDHTIRFVELDLPGKMVVKRRILAELHRCTGILDRQNHILEEGDLNDTFTFDQAMNDLDTESSDPKPVGIVCEGLLRYMNWPDKEKLAMNINRAIRYSMGGVWITPDIEFLSDANATPESRARYDMMAEKWGFDVRPFLFKDFDHAVGFFKGFGFKVAQHCHAGMAERLVSPARAGLTIKEVRAELAKRFTFVMSL